MLRLTQNQNEAKHSVVWSRGSKRLFSSILRFIIRITDIGVIPVIQCVVSFVKNTFVDAKKILKNTRKYYKKDEFNVHTVSATNLVYGFNFLRNWSIYIILLRGGLRGGRAPHFLQSLVLLPSLWKTTYCVYWS